MDKQINSYNIKLLKSLYDVQTNKPIKTNLIEVSCIYNLSDFYNFEIVVNQKKYYLTIMLPLGKLSSLWTFLENISNNIETSMNVELEGPEELLYAFNTDNNDFIRLVYISNGWFINVENQYGEFCGIQQVLSDGKLKVQFDIIVNRKQFILEFYKELYSIFYNKQIPQYDAVGQKNISGSQILREYFKDFDDNGLLILKNRNSKSVSDIEINWSNKL